MTGQATRELRLTEPAWQQQVVDLCNYRGLWSYHNPDSRRSSAGWPDLVIANLDAGRFIFAELKTTSGKVRPQQQAVLFALARAGLPAYVWRPDDLPEVSRVLANLAFGDTP